MNAAATLIAGALALAAGAALPPAAAQHHGIPQHTAAPDAREPVGFPAALKAHTLANMRDHLLALAQIQQALADGMYERAGQLAEQRLGMSSLTAHGAHEASKFMPQGMQDTGTSMHRSASRFAVEVQNSSASGDLGPALSALARTTQACVACHAGYRLE